jgi:hypothetical protein
VATELIPLPREDFATLVLDRPEIASALLLTPAWQDLSAPPAVLPAGREVGAALSRQLSGLTAWPWEESLVIVVGTGEHLSPGAVVVGDVAVLRIRNASPPSVADIVRTLAPALLHARFRPAAPDARCSEPLLSLAEALADAGSLALASLPPELRPVRDWFDVKAAAPAVAGLADLVLDRSAPWATREVRLDGMRALGGPGPELVNSAAALVEAFGDAKAARERPLDMLLAWGRARRRDRFPPLPRALRRALESPLEAGIPRARDEHAEEVGSAIAAAALRRTLEHGGLPSAPLAAGASLPLRELAAANARLKGESSVCSWLGTHLPAGLLTGCRQEDEEGGWVYARPAGGTRFEIVSRAASGEEVVLLTWPRWVLFPAVNGASQDLLFVDQEGLWQVPLQGGAPPRRIREGAFRHLTVPPGAPGWAAVRWPGGEVVVEAPHHHGTLPVRGRGGLSWLDRDILVAVDGTTAALASSEGETRALTADLRCSRSLTASAGGVVSGFASPCDPSLVRVDLGLQKVHALLRLASSPLGVQVLPDGSLVFGSGTGLYRWTGRGAAERVGAGLTPGPA